MTWLYDGFMFLITAFGFLVLISLVGAGLGWLWSKIGGTDGT